ncbi:coenzyme F420-0:L-glutamate ligase [Oryzobacter telluris]|uniref:coenzyme F420-0:L-glutamate ligase n=1 Tax=Oryzobacter telluris TaxID=3149179 RepID=UPI00370D549E
MSGAVPVTVVPVVGVGEVEAGDDLAEVLSSALVAAGTPLEAGDCLVVSSKVVSKALGLTWDGAREAAVDAATVRVVAERVGEGGGLTRVVEAVAGPVMAAAGVDASNTGPSGAVLLLPSDPDGEAVALRSALLSRLGLPDSAALGVVLSDTAGRAWRAGQTDFALGSAGVAVLDDLRGGVDHDGRPLAVTARALADEVAAAADLVKGKADGVPAAVVRGLDAGWFAPSADGARTLVRTGPGDWFALGSVEAVRGALGAAPGSAEALEVGVRSVRPDEPLAARVGRVVALALLDVPDGSVDVGVDEAAGAAEVTLGADDPYDLGRLVARLEVAAASESLTATVTGRAPTSVTLALT